MCSGNSNLGVIVIRFRWPSAESLQVMLQTGFVVADILLMGGPFVKGTNQQKHEKYTLVN